MQSTDCRSTQSVIRPDALHHCSWRESSGGPESYRPRQQRVGHCLVLETRTALNLLGHDPDRLGRAGCHEIAPFLEACTRLAVCVMVARSSGGPRPVLPRSGGYGTYLAILNDVTPSDDPLAKAMATALTTISQSLTGQAPEMTVQSTRNYILHGGAAPANDEYIERWRRWAEDASDAILTYLDALGGLTLGKDGRVELGGVALSPLVLLRDSRVCWFQGTSRDGVSYIASSSSGDLDVLKDNDILDEIRRFLRPSNKDSAHDELSGLYRAFVRDTEGFASPGTAPMDRTVDGIVLRVRWVAKSSAGDYEREDEFKVKPDNQWVWLEGGEWVSYARFLQVISNWPVVVDRLRSRISSLVAEEAKAAAQFSNNRDLIIPRSISTRFRATDEDGKEAAGPGEDGLNSFVDQAAMGVAGQPQVFFLSGEAGIGKTHALLEGTRRRHEELSGSESRSGAPLYLYLSCGGTGLRSISELVDAAVVDTQNLNFKSVLALCRNGLLVLVVDGFDELVGGAGYRDAYELLQPTLDKLEDRGTIMVAARSSYLANQYQSSLRRAQAKVDKSAVHTLLEINRWSTSDVEALFDSNPHWRLFRDRLKDRDLELLGVPFFSKVFNSFAQAYTPVIGDELNLRTVLIDGYLDRELAKLSTTPGPAREGIGVAQLRSVYLEVAGEMFETGSDVVGHDEFILACSAGVELDLSEPRYKSLGDRLSVLCGISATAVEGSPVAFSFEHDLFLESFLADYLWSQYLQNNEKRGAFMERLRYYLLGDATVESLVEKDVSVILAFLAEVPDLSNSDDEMLIQNLSLLAERSVGVATNQQLPILRGLEMRALSVSDRVVEKIWLQDCRVGQLQVASQATLSMVSCHVSQLVLGPQNQDLAGIQVDSLTEFGEVYDNRSAERSQLITSQTDIWSLMASLNLHGAESRLEKLRERPRSPLQNFAEDALVRFASLARPVYVVEASRKVPGDGASRWMRDQFNPCWTDFTNALLDSGAATERSINASGPAKLLISFKIPPQELLDQRDLREAVDFWQRLE